MSEPIAVVVSIKLYDQETNKKLFQLKSFSDRSEITTSPNIPLVLGVSSLTILNHEGDYITDVVSTIKNIISDSIYAEENNKTTQTMLTQRIEYLEAIISNHFG
jgi:hypothetical protein